MPVPAGKPTEVARLQAVQVAIDPDVGVAFEHEYELFLGAFRMWIRSPAARRQTFMVDANPRQAELARAVRRST